MNKWESQRAAAVFDAGSVISLYGCPPITDRWDPVQFPSDITITPYVPPRPEPIDPNAVIEARIAWLENELRQHAAWTLELAALRRALKAMEPVAIVHETKGKAHGDWNGDGDCG